MSNYLINVSVRAHDAARVCDCVKAVFAAHEFALIGDEAAMRVADDEDTLPDGDNWYGVFVSGVSGSGWVTVYVEDWADSGVLALSLSERLQAPALEVWVADDIHWGYSFFVNGAVADRFADSPALVAPVEELALYAGNAERLADILRVPSDTLQSALAAAQAASGEFAGTGIDALAQSVGLPFEHVFTGYEFFFEDDPEDYGPSLENWKAFRHLAFRAPKGRETLAD